jgi:MFS family permease
VPGEVVVNVDVVLDSRASWTRLGLLLLVSSIGGVGMWSVVVTLPAVQAEFGVARAGAALPYTLTMLGFAAGGVVMGRASDRFGIARVVAAAGVMLACGYALASVTHDLLSYAIVHGVLIGMLGSGAMFGPIMADASLWFHRRRGVAVAIAAAGNYVAGAVWPPIVAAATQSYGWRTTELLIGTIMLITVPPLAWLLRATPPEPHGASSARQAQATSQARLGLSPGALLTLLVVAGLGCCVAMSMPQVHIVAYCADLGYGPARGAQMLSVMLALGIVSRVGSGWIADRIGGLPTLLAGSVLQFASLSLFLFFDSLTSLYVISGLFGLFQGGIVPSYAIIVREYLPARGAAAKVGLVLAATIVGMALGGWVTGEIFDRTGSYRVAFVNGLAWNLLNGAIAVTLLARAYWRRGGGAGMRETVAFSG